MRILLFGKNGQLGRELEQLLPAAGEVISVGRADVDLENINDVRSFIRGIQPDCIVNAAAFADADLAETERERAIKVNHLAPEVMAEEAKKMGALLVHYSTDYVFDGTKKSPYVEGDAVNPINFYGLCKLRGEQAVQASGVDHLIFRTSWVYSLRKPGGFVSKVVGWAQTQEVMRVVDDQVGSPTWAQALAQASRDVLLSDREQLRSLKGLYHLSGGGSVTRYGWAVEILQHDPKKNSYVVKGPPACKIRRFSHAGSPPDVFSTGLREIPFVFWFLSAGLASISSGCAVEKLIFNGYPT